MAVIAPTLPTLGDLNQTEDVDTRNALQTIVNAINGGLDKDNLAAAAGILATQMGQGAAGLAAGTFHAFNSDAAFALAAAGVPTKVKLNSEDFDVSNWFDAATFRFTPQIAGYYRLSAYLQLVNGIDAGQILDLDVQKNGALSRRLGRAISSGAGLVLGAGGSCIVSANGSTDFFELWASQGNAATRLIQTGAALAWFAGELDGRS